MTDCRRGWRGAAPPAGSARDRYFVGRGSVYGRLEELGWPVATVREEISARMPTPEEAGALGDSARRAVIEVLHTSMNGWKRPFEVTRLIIAPIATPWTTRFRSRTEAGEPGRNRLLAVRQNHEKAMT